MDVLMFLCLPFFLRAKCESDLSPCFAHLSPQEIPFALASAAADAPPGRDADTQTQTVKTVKTQC